MGNVRPVLLREESADFSNGHASGIHGDDLVIKTGVTPLMLGDQDGGKTAISITGDIQPQRAISSQNRLASLAVALVGFILWALRARRIPQVVTKLGTQCSLDQSLLEGRRSVFDSLRGHQPLTELFEQLLGDFW
ncbi:hypothetical protein D3C79_701110 [compost metagenome]